MEEHRISLATVYDGWDGFNTSLVHAVAPRTPEELAFRGVSGGRSVGEIAAHIAMGRVNWFARMAAPMVEALERETEHLRGAAEQGPEPYKAIATDAAALVHWIERTWEMIDATLRSWTVEDLARSYRHAYWGKTYAVSYQWTIWRILTHDVYHGGQMTVLLAEQGIVPDELAALGGHLTEPPLVPSEPNPRPDPSGTIRQEADR
jgi:uncharacterized damage-inducible protein DinB